MLQRNGGSGSVGAGTHVHTTLIVNFFEQLLSMLFKIERLLLGGNLLKDRRVEG